MERTSAMTANGEVPPNGAQKYGLRQQHGSRAAKGRKLIRPEQAIAGPHLGPGSGVMKASGSKCSRDSSNPLRQLSSKQANHQKVATISPDIPGIALRTSTGTGANWHPGAVIDTRHGQRRALRRRARTGRGRTPEIRRPPCRQGRLHCQSHVHSLTRQQGAESPLTPKPGRSTAAL
jgi:hypothetical protein